MRRRRAVAALALTAGLLVAEAGEGPEGWFADAVRLAAEGDLDAAITSMEKVLAVEPEHPDALWDLGLWYSAAGRPQHALDAWTRYRAARPGEWRVLAKLVQAHQALGDLAARDRVREALLERRARATEIERASMDLFCRDQLRVGGRSVMAFESFEPQDPQPVLYRFSVLDPAGKEESWFVLTSSILATELARDEGAIGAEDRLFRLERRDTDGGRLVRTWSGPPSYDEVRALVVAALSEPDAP